MPDRDVLRQIHDAFVTYLIAPSQFWRLLLAHSLKMLVHGGFVLIAFHAYLGILLNERYTAQYARIFIIGI